MNPPASHRILAADDDRVFTMLASSCLDSAGFTTTVVATGADAMEMLCCEAFDLAILDLDMPRIDGFRLLGLIQGQRSLDDLAILVISSSRTPSDRQEALRLGADAFLSKPVDWAGLPGIVARLIENRGPGGLRGRPAD